LQNIPYGIYFFIGIAAFLAFEVLFLTLSNRFSYTRKVNARLRIMEDAEDQRDVLVLLRRQRRLNADGTFMLPIIWFNRLVLQSGIGINIRRILVFMGLAGGGALIVVLYQEGSILLALLAAIVFGGLLPVMGLKFVRMRRMRKFESQLPDAVDVVVRSLRAGHPLPIAIATVSREMPDPIGSEFGLTSDELTYGLDLEQAVNSMNTRVGQEDLALVIVAISIQSKTGGNLSEILSNLARVLRARFKMRRRVRALAAEGKFSAAALSCLPFLVFGALVTLSPTFYGDVWDVPLTKHVLGVAVGIMMIGNLIMYRMVNFRL
jgi:tight adherence protein B